MTNDLLERLSFLLLGEDDGDCGYAGVFSADKIPPELAGRSRFAILVNLDPWEEGEKRDALRRQRRQAKRRRRPHDEAHFVCIFAVADQVTFLDSYGMKPKQRHVCQFLRDCNRPTAFNSNQVQDFGSSFCGLYALLFLLRLAKRPASSIRFHREKSNLEKNDNLCLNYLLQLL
ncbi:MAG: hypothetical protein GDA54_06980 [Alphaproteobacteria bacterium GM7ARS4]|nr:hypothetical protein [Alphaproteobacteria bacterium GM7ARS4]